MAYCNQEKDKMKPRIEGILATLLITMGLLALGGLETAAQSLPPYSLQGTLTLDSTAAANADVKILLNSQTFTVTTNGSGIYFTVLGGATQGDVITFQVDGHEIVESYIYRENGGASNLSANLSNGTATFTQTATISQSTPITVGLANGAEGVAILATGGNLGSTQVVVKSNQDCTTVSGETVTRCFDITPTSPQTATLTFFFAQDQIPAGQSCTDLNVYHWDGLVWSSALALDPSYGSGGRLCQPSPYTAPHSIRVIEVNDFSPFGLKATSAPTAITLRSFDATTDPRRPIARYARLAAVLGLVAVAVVWRRRQPCILRRDLRPIKGDEMDQPQNQPRLNQPKEESGELRKLYTAPRVIYECHLEVQAGSPLSPDSMNLDLDPDNFRK